MKKTGEMTVENKDPYKINVLLAYDSAPTCGAILRMFDRISTRLRDKKIFNLCAFEFGLLERMDSFRWPSAKAGAAELVLVAFGDVQDSLSAIYHLARQAEAQNRAVAAARRAQELANERYRSGIVEYINVVDASRDTLAAERANAQLTGQRLIAAVQLIKAVGGGWTEQQILASAAPVAIQPAIAK